MRRFCVLAVALLLQVRIAWANESCSEALLAPQPDVYVQHAHLLGTTLNMQLVKTYLSEISGERPFADGYTLKERGSREGRMITRLKLKEYVENLGYVAQFENFFEGSNLIVELPGSKHPNEIVEVTAHYDSYGNPGADDNGSGVALMLEMLSHFRQAQPERTLRFVFMDLEESGFIGSTYHVNKIKEDPRHFIGSIVVDTIAWALDGGKNYLGVLEIGTESQGRGYKARLDFAHDLYYLLARIGIRDELVMSPELDGAKPGTADHTHYWETGVPAVLVAAPYEPGFINPNYHRKTDQIEHINWNYYRVMAQTVTEMVAYSARMTLKDPSQFSESAWQVLRSLENLSVDHELHVLPAPGDRAAALPPGFKVRRFSDFDHDDDDDDEPALGTVKPRVKPKLLGEVGNAYDEAKFDGFDLYVSRFANAIRLAPKRQAHMVLMPMIAGNQYRQGFIAANGEILDLTDTNEATYKILWNEVRAKGGRLYQLSPLKSSSDGYFNTIATVLKAQMARGKAEITVGNYHAARLHALPEIGAGVEVKSSEKDNQPSLFDSPIDVSKSHEP